MRKAAAVLVVCLAMLTLLPDASAHVKPNQKVNLVNTAGEVGGWVNVQQNANHVLRLVVALKHLEPNTAYTVWLLNCAGPPGAHPCGIGPLNFIEPFGARSPPGCPFSVGRGPMVTLTTNSAGNANSAAIHVRLQGVVASGQYFNHIDVRPSPCHPSGAFPPEAYTTAAGFSFQI